MKVFDKHTNSYDTCYEKKCKQYYFFSYCLFLKVLVVFYSNTHKLIKVITIVYLTGNSPCMVDFMIWPWFERVPVLTVIAPEAEIDSKKFPHLTSWMKLMMQLPAVQQTYDCLLYTSPSPRD